MSNKKLSKNQAISFSIISLSIMLIFSYVEVILPINLGSIGVKIGLSNIMTIVGIKILGIRTTLLINILRLIIIGILFGNVVRFAISVAGFCLCFIVMEFLIKRLNFSIITTSIFGGIFHNIGQLIAVAIITKGTMVFVLVPIYIIVGLATGFIIGIITKLIYDKIQLIMFD